MRCRACAALLGFVALVGCAAGSGGPPSSSPPAPRIQITGGATTGPLTLDRVELTFDNGFGSVTVDRGQRLGARAVVRFSGNGLFRATWLVDNRPVEQLQQLVTFGTTMTIEVGQVTPLPTFEPGNHEVTLRIEEPAPGIPVPAVRYFVK